MGKARSLPTKKYARTWRYLAKIKMEPLESLKLLKTKSRILNNVNHGNWILTQSKNVCYAKCFTKGCDTMIQLREHQNIVHVSMSGFCSNCDDQMFVSVKDSTTGRCMKKFHRDINNIIIDFYNKGLNTAHTYNEIQSKYPSHTISLEDITRFRALYHKRCASNTPNMKKALDRINFFNQFHVSSLEAYLLIHEDTKIITLACEENCLSIVYTSPKLIETNLKSTLKLDKIYITVDATYKSPNTGRKKSNGEQLWAMFAFGTVTLRWDTKKKKWTHSFRPFLFSLSISENQQAACLLFSTFYKVSNWFNIDKDSLQSKVVAFCSDEHKAYSAKKIKEFFPNADIAHCWPHISRKFREGEYCSKRSTICDHLSLALKILRNSKTKCEFDNNHKLVRNIIRKNINGGIKYSDVIDKICDKCVFHISFPCGMPGHTNSLERFFGDQLQSIRTKGALYLNENGGLYSMLKHAELKFTSNYIFYQVKDHNLSACPYERDMIQDALKLSNGTDIKEFTEDYKAAKKEYEENTANFNHCLNEKNNNDDEVKDEDVDADEDVDVEEKRFIEEYPYNNELINTRLCINDDNYFCENADDDIYNIGRVFAFVKKNSQIRAIIYQFQEQISGIEPFVNWDTGYFIKDMFCFRIVCKINGESDGDPGIYCISQKELDKVKISSHKSKVILSKLHLNHEDITTCSFAELRKVLSKCQIQDLQRNYTYYVNSSQFCSSVISKNRMDLLEKSRAGRLEPKQDGLEAFTEIDSAMSLNRVTYNSVSRSCECNCSYYTSRGTCKHELALRDRLGNIKLKNLLLDPRNNSTDKQKQQSYIKRKIRKWFDVFPVTHQSGYFHGVVSGIRYEDDNGNERELFKISYDKCSYYEHVIRSELDKLLYDSDPSSQSKSNVE